MKRLAISLALALATTTAAAAAPEGSTPEVVASTAPSNAKLELARRFVGLSTSSDEYAEEMLDGVDAMVATLVEEYEDDPHQQAVSLAMDDLLTRTKTKVRALAPLMFEATAQAYAREFSKDELRQLIAFTESPVGQHYASSMAVIAEDPAVIAAQDALYSAMDEITEEVGRELCTRSHDLQIASGEGEPCPYAEESVTRRG